MSGEYERLILSLIPWLHTVARREEVPAAEVDDVVAEVMEKALSVARDIESRQRQPPDKPPKQYFKEVMRNGIRDWKRSHPELGTLTPEEIAIMNAEMYSAAVDEGAEEVGGWQAVPAPGLSPSAGSRPCPFILAALRAMRRPSDLLRASADDLTNFRFWQEGGYEGEWKRMQQQLEAITKDDDREAVLLYLQGYLQKTIAARLFKSQQAVSKVLRKQFDVWGWEENEEQVRRIQCVLLYVNIKRVVSRVLKETSLHLDEAFQSYRKEENLWRKVYQAIKNDPALVCFTKNLQLRDMGELMHLVDAEDLFYLDLESPESAWPQLHQS